MEGGFDGAGGGVRPDGHGSAEFPVGYIQIHAAVLLTGVHQVSSTF